MGELYRQNFSLRGREILALRAKEKEAPGDEIPEPLTERVTGGIRTHNHLHRQRRALSVELQPHASAT
jgi:hypothetical protein